MTDRIAVMIGSEIVQFGTARNITPADVRVAQFIGTPRMNLLPAMVTGGVVRIRMAAPVGHCAGCDSTARVGVRSEHVSVAGRAGARRRGPPWVSGAELLVHIARARNGGTIVLRAPDSDGLRAGQDVGLRFAAGALHLFGAPAGAMRRAGVQRATAPLEAAQ